MAKCQSVQDGQENTRVHSSVEQGTDGSETTETDSLEGEVCICGTVCPRHHCLLRCQVCGVEVEVEVGGGRQMAGSESGCLSLGVWSWYGAADADLLT